MDIRRTRVVTFILAAAVQCAALLISAPQTRPQPDELIETVVVEMSASEAVRLAWATPGSGIGAGSPLPADGRAFAQNRQIQTPGISPEPIVESTPTTMPNPAGTLEVKAPLQGVENQPPSELQSNPAADVSGNAPPAVPQGPSVAGQPPAGSPEQEGTSNGSPPSGGTGENPGPGGATGPAGKGTPGPDWKDVYAARVMLHVEQFKRYPNWAIERRVSGTVTLQLCLRRDGGLKSVTVVGSSGSKGLDAEAVQTAKEARPYPAFPEEADQDQIYVIIRLTYQIKTK